MKFKHKLYHYQQDVLKVFQKEIERWDKKIHVVAPPWSGKTIMGLEMISRIEGNHLILVPNITLQYQWRDKIEQFFLEEWESIDEVVSTTIDEVKKVNILTYQSLTSSNRNNDLILDKIFEKWYFSVKTEFKNKEEFFEYVEVLKDIDIEEYKEKISKYKKVLKTWKQDFVEKILSKKILDYFSTLKKNNIESIVVDEAHHLTSWWSKVIYYLWEWLWNEESDNFNSKNKTDKISESIITEVLKLTNKNKYSKIANFPLIIWLTATPPYDDIDFFILDDDYSKLLWEVDYYIPTPAVVKSARLAPWSDLVYFVEPWEDLKNTLEKTDKKLELFLKNNKEKICNYIFSLLEKNYDSMLNKSHSRLINYLKFLNNYSDNDISKYYFDEKIWEEILLLDIAKTVWKYLSYLEIWKIKNNWSLSHLKKGIIGEFFIEKTKKLFYELWFIWRSNNFYKFRTRIENMLIYSKSKIDWIKTILDKEIQNLWGNLKCAIITDFLEDRDWIINCKYILKELYKYKSLNPRLVSWQWIWKLSENWELEEIESNILEVTKELEEWKINLVIWTRWILWEWWDCPWLNTLIDLTGIVAYMSVNQVRWRAIRLDKNNLNKVANVYDIVTYFEWYTKEVDLYRLERKHEKFYWVDDTGLIIRWVDHIYPNIRKNISNYKKINENMLKRSSLRSYYYKLWWIWGKYENKEVFWLDLELNTLEKYIPFVNFRVYDSFSFFKFLKEKEKLDNILKNKFYRELMKRFLKDFLKNIVKSLKQTSELPQKFSYDLIESKSWNFKLVSSYKDDLVIKKFILDISTIFKTISTQKYVLDYPFAYYDWENIELKYLPFWLPDSLSKNQVYRGIFSKELKNDFLKSWFLLNLSSLIDKWIKVPILWWSLTWINLLSTFSPVLIPSILPFIWMWWLILFFIPMFYKKRNKLIKQYKELFNKFITGYWYYSYRFIYLNSKKTNKNDYIWKKPIIEAKVEKLWI